MLSRAAAGPQSTMSSSQAQAGARVETSMAPWLWRSAHVEKKQETPSYQGILLTWACTRG